MIPEPAMSHQPTGSTAAAIEAAMPFARLQGELDAWRKLGRTATLWWRDDDAVDASEPLDRLIGLSARYGVPLALAVIPAHLQPGLREAVAAAPLVTVLQHGWSHHNHGPDGAKTIEMTDARGPDAVDDELTEGDERLAAMFGDQYRRVLVPPWNRIDEATAARALAGRYRAVSGFGPRDPGAPGWLNTHVDPIDWRGHRGFLGSEAVLGQLVDHLAARRAQTADPDEPTGLMTHHLVHDAASWSFVEMLLRVTISHPSTRWLPVSALLDTGAEAA